MEKFLINEDEKNRILNMHQNRTSNHYLTESEEDEVEEVYEDEDEVDGNYMSVMGGRGYNIKIMDSEEGEPVLHIKCKKSALPNLVDELSRFAKNVDKF